MESEFGRQGNPQRDSAFNGRALVAKFPWTGTISLPKREDPCGLSGETEGQPTYLFDQAAE